MKRISFFLCIFLLIPFFSLSARDNVVFYQMGDRDTGLWDGLKKYFADKGYGVIVYKSANSIEQQIQNANKINKEKASIFLAIELVPSEKEDIFVAMPQTRKGKGNILEIDEVSGVHGADSEELALSIAAPFNAKVKRAPLFAFLGIDMPGIFLKIGCTRDKARDMFSRVDKGLQKYLNRGEKNENERKSE